MIISSLQKNDFIFELTNFTFQFLFDSFEYLEFRNLIRSDQMLRFDDCNIHEIQNILKTK